VPPKYLILLAACLRKRQREREGEREGVREGERQQHGTASLVNFSNMNQL